MRIGLRQENRGGRHFHDFSSFQWVIHFTVTYIPGENMLHVVCIIDTEEMDMYTNIVLNHSTKTMHIAACTCFGSKMLFSYVCDRIKHLMVRGFLGDLWKVEIDQTVSQGVCESDICIMDENIAKMPFAYDVRKHVVIGHFEFAQEEEVARILAAFRGWKVRMEYRFNPNTLLGRNCSKRSMVE